MAAAIRFLGIPQAVKHAIFKDDTSALQVAFKKRRSWTVGQIDFMFRFAARHGKTASCRWLWNNTEVDPVCQDAKAFMGAATWGHLDTCKWFAKIVCGADEYYVTETHLRQAFHNCLAFGRIKVAAWIWRMRGDDNQRIISEDGVRDAFDHFYSEKQAISCKWLGRLRTDAGKRIVNMSEEELTAACAAISDTP